MEEQNKPIQQDSSINTDIWMSGLRNNQGYNLEKLIKNNQNNIEKRHI
jgi:hypothetical protein